MDGNHRFDAVFVDLFHLGRLLRPGGIIFLDDYQLPGVARAASFFTANLGWAVEESCTAQDRHHWAVLRTSASPGHPALRLLLRLLAKRPRQRDR